MKRAIRTSIGRPFLRPVIISVALVLLCFALAPLAEATPPPKSEDRGNGNSAAENVSALNPSTTGSNNTAHGWFSLFSNTTGNNNTADGFLALFSNTAGEFNTANGYQALLSNTTGDNNTANGVQALANNTFGNRNAASGSEALGSNTTGGGNTANGFAALLSNTTGNDNTVNGVDALENNTTGSNNVALGARAGSGVSTASNVTCIGADVGAADVSNTTWIGNVYGVTTQSGITAPVIVSDTGQLGTVASSERFKKDIATMEKASEAILSLRPVTFHYKSDTREIPQFGLIAEEVAKVSPNLVVRDKKGEIYTVRYDAVNAMLLNEFLKEHKAFLEEQRKVQEQQATITQLRKDFGATVAQLTARLDEQAAQIQKVSAQVEMSKPGARMVSNNH